MRSLILIAHNVRSCHNVGSLLRTAEGIGARKVYLTGYTPYPANSNDTRLPHIQTKLTKKISKTALGSHEFINWTHDSSIKRVMEQLRHDGYEICALEQTPQSLSMPDYHPSDRVAIIVGREVEGLEAEIIAKSDKILQIPMFGKKESFNVVQACAMALYHCRFY
ncbi:MAG: TrmH family RNA methyltransferase [Candidatus Saccharibacteria bacterium]|nr:TrmH family RNA methyltransferase [Candidatus Saccharibacteria bacterium]